MPNDIRVTLHPAKSDGSLDTDTNLYPKTSPAQVQFSTDQREAVNSGITAGRVQKLDGIEDGAEANIIEGIKVNGTAVSPDSDKIVDIQNVAKTNTDNQFTTTQKITGADDTCLNLHANDVAKCNIAYFNSSGTRFGNIGVTNEYKPFFWAGGGATSGYFVLENTDETISGAKRFTGTVGNLQTNEGVYLGLDENTDAVNANIAIVSANTASYIDFGRPNVDYDFRIIKWNQDDNKYAQLVYAGNATSSTLTIPMENGTLATKEWAGNTYFPKTGGTLTGDATVNFNSKGTLRPGSGGGIEFYSGTANYRYFKPATDGNYYSLGSPSYRWGYLFLSGGIRTGSGNYSLLVPSTTSWTNDKTIATTDDLTNYLPLTGGTLTTNDGINFNSKGTIRSRSGGGLELYSGTANYRYFFPATDNAYVMGGDTSRWFYVNTVRLKNSTTATTHYLLVPDTTSWSADKTIATIDDTKNITGNVIISSGYLAAQNGLITGNGVIEADQVQYTLPTSGSGGTIATLTDLKKEFLKPYQKAVATDGPSFKLISGIGTIKYTFSQPKSRGNIRSKLVKVNMEEGWGTRLRNAKPQSFESMAILANDTAFTGLDCLKKTLNNLTNNYLLLINSQTLLQLYNANTTRFKYIVPKYDSLLSTTDNTWKQKIIYSITGTQLASIVTTYKNHPVARIIQGLASKVTSTKLQTHARLMIKFINNYTDKTNGFSGNISSYYVRVQFHYDSVDNIYYFELDTKKMVK